jgi:drug/metabolite transporter (DMT)-like permease
VLAIPYARERKIVPARLTRWQWALAIGAGVFFALDLAFWNTSLGITNAANATVLGNVAPIVVGLGAIVLFHERPKGLYYVGLIVAIVGMSIIGGWDALAHTSLGLGDLLAVIGGVFYGGYLLSTQRIRERMTALTSLWVSGMSGSVFLLLFNLIAGRPLGGFALGSWAALLALGVISQALGWLAINHALGHIPASRVSVLLLLQPVLTAIFAVPLLGEALGAHQIIGGLIAIAGIALVNRARG